MSRGLVTFIGDNRRALRTGIARSADATVTYSTSKIEHAVPLAGSRLHLKLHLIRDCAAEDGCERRVRSISALSNTHEARLWTKASRVEKNPACVLVIPDSVIARIGDKISGLHLASTASKAASRQSPRI
jgi:hypothetical protein